MHLGCWERFLPPPRISDPDMHRGTCVTHMPWCMPGSLTSGFLWSWWRGYVLDITGACATHNFTYLVRGPWCQLFRRHWLHRRLSLELCYQLAWYWLYKLNIFMSIVDIVIRIPVTFPSVAEWYLIQIDIYVCLFLNQIEMPVSI